MFWSLSVFSLPPELMRKETKVLVEISDDSDNDEEKIGFVQHLSATKRFHRRLLYLHLSVIFNQVDAI